MEEPSVLDYVKAKLIFWRESDITIEGIEGDESSRSIITEQLEAIPEVAPPSKDELMLESSHERLSWEEQKTSPRAIPMRSFSRGARWGSVVAVAMGLLAQRLFEPPNRSLALGLIIYTLAAACLLWINLRGGWQLADIDVNDETEGNNSFNYNLPGLVLCIVFSLVTFIALGGNRFTDLNLLLLGITFSAFLYSFWARDPREKPLLKRIWAYATQLLKRGVLFSPWTLLFIFAFALTTFFRFYNLEGVPAEMFSDHAEKLLDVADVLDGETRIYFPRNTGREALQMYLTAGVAQIFGTGLSYLSLKIGTGLAGMVTLLYIYLLGKELANRRVGLIAMTFAGIAYWPNVISRVALRFALYPLFVAPTLYYLLRGLRRRRRNDFILAGVALGLGLHGYSPFRVVPIVVLVAVGLYLIHHRSMRWGRVAVFGLALTALASMILFLPLLRYALENPQVFSYRMMTRLTSLERPLPGSAGIIFLENLWRAVTMFAWDNGEIWVHSVPHRPALGLVSAVFFYFGVFLLFIRYLRRRNWQDLFLLLSVPLLLIPSVISLAFPAENPSLNRTAGAVVPVFLIVGLSLDGFLNTMTLHQITDWRNRIVWGVAGLLLFFSASQNFDLVFRQYHTQFRQGSWNTSEMGAVIRNFATTVGDKDSAWVVPYPHWVDTRLVGIQAGYPRKDYALWPNEIPETISDPKPKLFLFKPEDEETAAILRQQYPDGALSLYDSNLEGKDFWLYFVPPQE
ncbi:MAG: glycosyltransferase family 39 protein [Anaerolineales bacterium]